MNSSTPSQSSSGATQSTSDPKSLAIDSPTGLSDTTVEEFCKHTLPQTSTYSQIEEQLRMHEQASENLKKQLATMRASFISSSSTSSSAPSLQPISSIIPTESLRDQTPFGLSKAIFSDLSTVDKLETSNPKTKKVWYL